MNKEEEFRIECDKTIKILEEENHSFKEFSYFLNLAKNLYSKKEKTKRVIMISHSFPDEILRAINVEPCYVFGGSYQASKFDNVNLPKDCNDQAKSILGILKSKFFDLSLDDILLIPYTNDNYKMFETLLKNQVKVIGYDVPTNKNDPLMRKRFTQEIKRTTSEICKYFHKHVNPLKIKKECEISKNTVENWDIFEKLFIENKTNFTLSGFIFVLNSYYMTSNKIEWSNHLERLINEIRKSVHPLEENERKLLLAGSPIYAPNYKIIFEAESLNLNVKYVMHPDVNTIKLFSGLDKKISSITSLALKYFDSSKNSLNLEELVKSKKIDGVIFHIIKGEVQFAFNYQLLEKQLLKNNLPIVKIETVYDYQDIEQIRLRLEAFSEIFK